MPKTQFFKVEYETQIAGSAGRLSFTQFERSQTELKRTIREALADPSLVSFSFERVDSVPESYKRAFDWPLVKVK